MRPSHLTASYLGSCIQERNPPNVGNNTRPGLGDYLTYVLNFQMLNLSFIVIVIHTGENPYKACDIKYIQ